MQEHTALTWAAADRRHYLKFNGIEHFDRFEDGIIYWAEISDVPDAIQSKAQQIDGPAYNSNCFGLCVCYDTATNKFELVTDTDLSTGNSRNIYYIDNDGNKHWYKSDLAPAFIEQIFGTCDRLIRGKDTLQGYQIQKYTLFENGRGISLAESPNAPQPFVTWMFTKDKNGIHEYEWGHYFINRAEAERDFSTRVEDYQRRYGVREIKQPIAGQIKDAQRLAGKHRGRTAPNKSARDKGNER